MKDSLFPKLETKQKYLFSLLLFNVVLKVCASVIKQEKEIQGIQIGKVSVKDTQSCPTLCDPID